MTHGQEAQPRPTSSGLDAVTVGEVLRLHAAIQPEARLRMAISSASLAAAALIVAPWLAALCLVIDAVADRLSLRHLRRFAENRQRRDYHAFLALTAIANVAFVMPATVMLATGDNYASFVAMFYVFGTILHVTTMLAIHRRAALICLGACIVPVAVANFVALSTAQDYTLLGWTSLAFLAITAYALSTILSTGRMHAALAEAQRRSEAATAARDRLLAVMSHEMRTPLNAVTGIAAELRAKRGTPPSAEHVAILSSASDDLRGLVDDLVDLSAIGSGGLRVTPAPGEPVAEIRHAVERQRPAARAKGLTLEMRVGEGVPEHAEIARLRLRQAVGNLVSNAVAYTDCGAVRVHLERGAGDLLAVVVEDTGPGVPEKDRARIFEPFTRLDDPPGRTTTGLGLGLPITRELARRMGGDLVIESAEGGGARFRLSFAAPACSALSPPPRAARLPAGLRVLVVDDLATNRIVARLYLDKLGIEMAEAEDCETALARLEAEAFDAVLLDLRMPGTGGAGTLARIRGSGAPWAGLPVIAMTADAGREPRRQARADGFDGFVAKPVDRASLLQALSNALERARPAVALRRAGE